MALFHKRDILRKKTLGERLRKVREETGLTIAEAEAATQIRGKYLIALEAGEYSALPGPVYIESFLKKYAEFLKVNSDFVLDLYRHQEQKVVSNKFKPAFPSSKRGVPREIITPKVIRLAVIVVIIGACLTYVGFEVAKIFSPPPLAIISPADHLTVSVSQVEVAGSTQPEAILTINGQRTYLDPQGRFSENVDLKAGLNVITVSAAKEKSKAMTIVLNVLYEQPNDLNNTIDNN